MVSDTANTTRMTGAEAIVASLEALGVTDVFGMPGGAILPTYDPLLASTSIRHILVRHEQGAGHAAEGYAVATGKVGCAIVTSGPGATNVLTALGDACMDSVPIVVISGQVGASLIGSDAFQEADVVGASMPITKHSFLVTDPAEIPARLAEAFHLAGTGRPGPVLVDITKSAQVAAMDFSWPPALDLPGYRVADKPNMKQVRAAARAIADAQAPVLYVGGGIVRSGSTDALADLVEVTNAPVVTTLTARGAFPDSDRHNLGMPGMHGTVPAVAAMQRSDLLITIGARFDDRVTGDVASFAPDAKVIHADIDPAEIGKIRAVDVPIVGDAREVLSGLLSVYQNSGLAVPSLSNWRDYLNDLKQRFPRGWEDQSDGSLSPQFVIQTLSQEAGPDAIYCAGVGQHQMWAAQFVDYEKPRTWLNSGGLGTMGYAIPAAMGAKAGRPDAEVWAIDGDGCFQMTNQELVTCAMEGFPIKVALINNGNLGMVRQWQALFYGERYSNTRLREQGNYMPDFVKLSESMGCVAIRVTKEEEVLPAIRKAREINDRPVVIDFIVGEDAQVWPMVSAGSSNSDIQYALGLRPLFDEDSAAESPAHIDEVVDANATAASHKVTKEDNN